MSASPRSVAAALHAAVGALREAGVADPAGDARRLMGFALQVTPERLALHRSDLLTPATAARFDAALRARAARCPVAQITGQRAFWGRTFRVTGAVLDPRPETETLIAEALSAPFARMLDLGTGSGAIMLSLLAERPGATGVGVDVSAAALAVARENAAALGLGGRAEFCRSDWFAAVTGRFDLIAANPPYVTASEWAALEPEVRLWEPRGALVPERDPGDGLEAYRQILTQAGGFLMPGGRLLFEVGSTQAQAVGALAEAAGFAAVRIQNDLNGHARVVSASRE